MIDEQKCFFRLIKHATNRIYSRPRGYWTVCLLLLAMLSASIYASKVPVQALYIPLADHYAGIVAYERYRNTPTCRFFYRTNA